MALSRFYTIAEVVVPPATATAYTIPDKARHVVMGVDGETGGIAELRLTAAATVGKDLPLTFENEPELAGETVYFYSTAGATVQVLTRVRLA